MQNKETTAFPAQAAQDSLGKIFTPFPGFTKYEYVLLQFALIGANDMTGPENLTVDQITDNLMRGAQCLTDAYFRALEQPEAVKNDFFTIIQ